MNFKKKIFTVLFALVLLPVFSGIAEAHVEISPSKAPAGKQVKLAFEIGHGCDGAATNALVVQLPPEAANASGKPVKGWKVKSTQDKLTWTGGPLADHDHLTYPFTATLYGKKGKDVIFKAIQRCEGGAETAWIATEGGSSEADNPAPVLTLTSTAKEPVVDEEISIDEYAKEGAVEAGEPTATDAPADEDSDDGNGRSVLLLIVAGLAIGTIAGIVVRNRRKK